jgi:hypothetical protein
LTLPISGWRGFVCTVPAYASVDRSSFIRGLHDVYDLRETFEKHGSDGPYLNAVEETYGADVDYAILVKL